VDTHAEELAQTQTHTQAQLEAVRKQASQLEQDKARLHTELTSTHTQLTALEKEHQKLTHTHTHTHNELLRVQAMCVDLQEEKKTYSNTHNDTHKALTHTQKQLAEVENRHRGAEAQVCCRLHMSAKLRCLSISHTRTHTFTQINSYTHKHTNISFWPLMLICRWQEKRP